MANGEDVVKWFFKKKFLGPPPMAIAFYYVSSVHNQVIRL